MIAHRKLKLKYIKWNRKWGAPFGKEYSPKPSIFSSISIIKYLKNIKSLMNSKLLIKILGMFGFQENSDTRIFEYPWAYYATPLNKGMQVLEIGGGLSGFQFVLSKKGIKVINVDPGDKKHKWTYTKSFFERLNNSFKTDVQLIPDRIEKANLKPNFFDRVYCISVLEHLSKGDRENIMNKVYSLLKEGGYFIITVDLFLNIFPFSNRLRNRYGTNISISNLIKDSKFKLVFGKPSELLGFPEFEYKKILTNLEKYYIGSAYPVLSQVFVLKK